MLTLGMERHLGLLRVLSTGSPSLGLVAPPQTMYSETKVRPSCRVTGGERCVFVMGLSGDRLLVPHH